MEDRQADWRQVTMNESGLYEFGSGALQRNFLRTRERRSE
jgi:hypothetical protein